MKKDILNCENVLQIVRMGVGFDHAPRRLPAFTDIESREKCRAGRCTTGIGCVRKYKRGLQVAKAM